MTEKCRPERAASASLRPLKLMHARASELKGDNFAQQSETHENGRGTKLIY